MTLLHIDAPTGLAGNMVLAALLDLGVPETVIHAPLADLGLAGRYRLEVEERRSSGLRGLHLAVHSLEQEAHHRPWGELRDLLGSAPLAPPLAERVGQVFQLLAEAEARVHGHAPEAVHFHEVGALDSLVDVVGVCAALLHLGVSQVSCGVPPAGHGNVRTAHGLLPLPAPAVLEIARRRGLALADSSGLPAAELTTPTGLALMACWAHRFGVAPGGVPEAVGVGLGSHCLDRPNLLRALLLRPLAAGPEPGPPALANEREETLLLQEAQIDDATAEDLAFLAAALRHAGALEVFTTAITMKKGRQGALVSALAPPALGADLRQVWWRHGTSLGLREQLQRRWYLPRQIDSHTTPLGPVRIKWAQGPDGEWRAKAEHGDLAHLAHLHGLSLREVRRQIEPFMSTRTTAPTALTIPERHGGELP
ncbi:MAG: LarC family nickel insertion protein [Cyanobacteria bacterium]|nr:LarC family nickel insertion protein [Cyanobacteriota bacterium]